MKNKILTLVLTVFLFGGMLVLPSCGYEVEDPAQVVQAVYTGNLEAEVMTGEITLEVKGNNAYTLTMDMVVDTLSGLKGIITGTYGENATVTSYKAITTAFGKELNETEFSEYGLVQAQENTNLIVEDNYAFVSMGDSGVTVLTKKDYTPANPNGILHVWGTERFAGKNYDFSITKEGKLSDLIDATDYVVIYNNGIYENYDSNSSGVLGITGVKFGTEGTYNAVYTFENGQNVTFKVKVETPKTLTLNNELFTSEYIAKGTELSTLITGKTVKVTGTTDAAVSITADMISGYDNTTVGFQTVTLTYENVTKVYYITVYDADNIVPVEYSGALYFVVEKGTERAAMTDKISYSLSSGVSSDEIALNATSIELVDYVKDETGLQEVTIKYTYSGTGEGETAKTVSHKVLFYVIDTTSDTKVNPVINYGFAGEGEGISNFIVVEADESGDYSFDDVKITSIKMDETTTEGVALSATDIGYESTNPKIYVGDGNIADIVGNANFSNLYYTIEKTVKIGTYETTVKLYVVLVPHNSGD